MPPLPPRSAPGAGRLGNRSNDRWRRTIGNIGSTDGPDLTHVGSRRSVATAEMPNEAGPLMAWIAAPQHIKPGALMPGFGMLPDADARALAAYLHGLQ